MHETNSNQVVSDKQLIKHLQKEVARLEAARTPDPLSEKDYKIQQVLNQIMSTVYGNIEFKINIHVLSIMYLAKRILWCVLDGERNRGTENSKGSCKVSG